MDPFREGAGTRSVKAAPRPGALDEEKVLAIGILEESDGAEILDRFLHDGEREVVVGHHLLTETGDFGEGAVFV